MVKPSENPKRKSTVIIAAIIIVILIVIAIIILIPKYWAPSPAEVNITTHVSDITSGASIPRAKIILLLEGNSFVGFSDGDGNHTFRVEATRESDARLFVEAAGYEVYDTSVELSKDRFVDLKLVSTDSDNRKIIVRVVDDSTNLPIEGARVVFLARGNSYNDTTDSNGIAIFTIEFTSEPIDVDITVSAPNNEFSLRNESVTVRPDQVQDIRLNNSANELSVVPFESSGSPSTDNTNNLIAYDRPLTGAITVAAQKIRYTFNGKSGDVVLITLIITDGELRPGIRLYDPEGKEIRKDQSYGENVELDEILLPVTGEYVILVGDGFNGPQTGQYSINIQKIR